MRRLYPFLQLFTLHCLTPSPPTLSTPTLHPLHLHPLYTLHPPPFPPPSPLHPSTLSTPPFTPPPPAPPFPLHPLHSTLSTPHPLPSPLRLPLNLLHSTLHSPSLHPLHSILSTPSTLSTPSNFGGCFNQSLERATLPNCLYRIWLLDLASTRVWNEPPSPPLSPPFHPLLPPLSAPLHSPLEPTHHMYPPLYTLDPLFAPSTLNSTVSTLHPLHPLSTLSPPSISTSPPPFPTLSLPSTASFLSPLSLSTLSTFHFPPSSSPLTLRFQLTYCGTGVPERPKTKMMSCVEKNVLEQPQLKRFRLGLGKWVVEVVFVIILCRSRRCCRRHSSLSL